MKKLIACALLLAMMLSLFAGCNTSATPEINPTEAPATTDLTAAAEYVKTIYKDVEESTPIDYQRVGTVRIGTDNYTVTWSADVAEDLVKIVEGANGMVTIDVSDSNPEDVPYVLTATITDVNGDSTTLTWNHFLPAAIVGDFSEILDMAYALEDGESLPNSCTLTGIITTINTAWSDDYQNITVTMVMEGCEDKPVMCYRLKGEGAKDLAPGDQITVTGTIKNYKGTIEFDAGCTLDEVVKGVGEVAQAPEDPIQILDEAYALAQGQALPYTATLTGKILNVDTAWSSQYKNITVTIAVEGDNRTVQCYRLKGEGAEELCKDDVITVTGTLKNYYGKIEFDAGCQLVDVVPGPRTPLTFPDQPEDPLQIVDEAYELAEGRNLRYNVRISGYVTGIASPWNDRYHNISVYMVVPGREDKPIYCYRMHGSENGADTLEVGDYITVFGSIKNYKGTIEFFAGAHCEKVVKGDGTLPWTPDEPEADTTLSIADAIALGESKAHNTYTTGKYYVTGVITEVYNTTYGNMKIKDEAGNILTIYGTYSADGKLRYDKMDVKPVAGDTVTVYGIIGQYNGTAQMKNGWIVEHVPAGSEPEVPEEPEVPTLPTTDGAAVSVADAIAAGEAMDHNTYTSLKYKVTGVITEVYNTTYGNMKITDGAGNVLTIYGTYSADGKTRYDKMDVKPVAGDTVTIYGPIGQFNGTAQIKNGWIVEHVPAGSEPEVPEEPEVPTLPTTDGAAVSVADAIAAGEAMDHNTYTSLKYKVTGVITEVYNTTYGNMKITDGAGNVLTIYGTYSADGKTRYDKMDVKPVAGDTVTIYGPIGQFNGTAQIKNGWIVEHVPAGSEPEVPEEPEVPTLPTTDGAAVSVADAIAAGEAMDHNTYTSLKYSVTGVITEVYNTQYGNMKITDGAGNVLTIYGTYSADGQTRYDKMDVKPVAGDTVTIYGPIGQFNGTAQIKNGWIIAHTPAEGSGEEEPEVPEVDASSSLEDVLAAAAALNPGEKLSFSYTITGTISTSYGYNSSFGNITVIMDVLDTTVQCYRLTGTGVDQIAERDTITVTGVLGKNSSGYIRFEQGCTLDSWTDNTP